MAAYGLARISRIDAAHEIVRKAKEHLGRNPYMSVRRVSCDFDRGHLFLRGRLSSFFHKQVAQEAVADMEGVTQVVNEIEVVMPLSAAG